jgi:NAD(P)-dependent dehydrogenase (short-subunit alcohol dehydrogenase family)
MIWSMMKTWRKLTFGPLSLVYKFERSVPVTRNKTRRLNPGRREMDVHALEAIKSESPQGNGLRRQRGVAMIVGVGPGFGRALAHHLAGEGFEVVLASRNATRLDALVKEITLHGGKAVAYGCDATMETSVKALFSLVTANHGVPMLVVYSIQSFGPGAVVDVEVAAFEDGWKHNCLGSFLVARSAAREMLPRSEGTIVLVGSTSSMIGRSGHLNLAVGKFGQRALAQVLARELWPRGIHVAHVVIDADITDDQTPIDDLAHSDPAHIAQVVLNLHEQPRSAWTSEVDVRPWNEHFWEHC